MIRNLKALGLALCAVFMFGAMSASSALATDMFTSKSLSGTTHLTSEQVAGPHPHVFATKWKPTAKVECTKGTYSGTYTGTATSSVEVTPAYSGCTTVGGAGATVDEEGCKFVLTGVTDPYTNTENVAEGEKATVSLNCSHTGQIKITGPLGCTITFKDTSGANTVNQNRLGVTYDNGKDASGKWDVTETVTVDKIHYTSVNCGFLGVTATDNDGFLTTNVTTRAYEDAEHKKQVDLTVS